MATTEMNYVEGGGRTPINLWVTSDKSVAPSGSTPVTLSDAIENYDEVRITYRNSTTDTFEREMIFKVSEAKTDSNTKYVYFGGYLGSTGTYARYMSVNGGTSMTIGNCYQIQGSGSNNNLFYPVSIDGFK